MANNLFHVDAFTREPFRGNPAAVCLLDAAKPDAWLAAMGAEMNLPETAFLLKLADNRYQLRWFTPTLEVDLCGHATIASAHVLLQEKLVDPTTPIVFESRSGELTAIERDGLIVLDFPAEPVAPCEAPSFLGEALGSRIVWCGKNRMDYLVGLESERAVLDLKPHLGHLEKLESRGVVVTARAAATPNADFVSRAFFPGVGIAEDPVTGSAHCMLAPYWQAKLGRATLTGYQASKRGGYVRCTIKERRVELGGEAVTIARGELSVA